MKIYFAAAITRYRKLLPLYQGLVGIISELGHTVSSKHVADAKITSGEWEKEYDPKKLWQREVNRLKASEAIVAEVTTQSWGTAFLIEKALQLKKPMICLYYGDMASQIPLMLQGRKELNLRLYTENTVKLTLESFFKKVKKRVK